MLIFIFLIFLFVTNISGEDSNIIVPENNVLKSDSISKADISFKDSTIILMDTVPLCTLEINTIPSEAAIFLDGKEYGTSPVTVMIDTGTHTIICQKEGFYQKKVLIQVSSYERTSVSIQLTSPAKLKIITEPAGAEISINGEKKGVTPYIDSLFKPGKYILKLEKEGYVSKLDSLELEGGVYVTKFDTLQKVVVPLSQEKKRFSLFDIYFTGGAFLVFLLIIGLIEIKN